MATAQQRFPALVTLEQAPFSAVLGIKVESASVGEVVARMPFDARLLNYGPSNVPIHGGAIASLADVAACAAVWTMPETQRSATISMTVNYTGPGVQSDLIAHARVLANSPPAPSINVQSLTTKIALIAHAPVPYK